MQNNVTSAYSTPQSFDWEWPSTVSGLTVTDTVDSTGDSYADDTIYEPRFSWDAVAGAAKYDVDISLDSNFATGSTTRYSTIGTSLSPTARAGERRLLLARPRDRPGQRRG